jgi:CHAT domain-containing protein
MSNACDVGQAHRVAHVVYGWGPAVLEVGASGYIGGLWPLGDQGAAAFAGLFYPPLAQGPVAVAELLRLTRRHFYETGDPTFLAYVYYGDAHLQVFQAP